MEKTFLDTGNLEAGIHTYKIDTFERQFVSGFPESVSRSAIYENFRKWIEMLLSILPPRCVWLDGSFLTKKTNPNDIDLIIFYEPEDFTNADLAAKVQHHVNVVSRNMNCDAYLCFTFDHWDPADLQNLPNEVRISRTYWMGQFSYDRQMNPKGMVKFSQEEIMSKLIGGVTK